MKSVFFVIICIFLLDFSLKTAAYSAEYKTRLLVLDIDKPDRESVGALAWRGGVEILSEDSRFGGLSGLHVSKDGRHLTAVSDHGYWFNASLHYNKGRLDGIQSPRLTKMLNTDQSPLIKPDTDAESIATHDEKTLFVSFERRHRIWRNANMNTRPQVVSTPQGLSKLPGNGGVEAMTHLCDGRLMIVAEKNKSRSAQVQGWIQSGDRWETFSYKTVAGFRPTGAATLPDCTIIFIERSFSFISGISARVVIVDDDAFHASHFRAAHIIEPVEIARFDGSLTVDNLEGVSARKNEAGETIIYLVSDDNYNPLQRTLLMMFAYTAP